MIKKINNWFKGVIIRWLGLNNDRAKIQQLFALTEGLVSIGVDVHFKEPHMILIYSRLGGGQIREIRADFKNIGELKLLVNQLKYRYNTSRVTYDTPHGFDRGFLG